IGENELVPTSVPLYQQSPRQIVLQPIQAIVRTETRLQALFSDSHDQLQSQMSMTAEFMYETQEHLIFHHPDHGLLNNVDPSIELTAEGPPSPDVLDDLLSLVWKRADC